MTFKLAAILFFIATYHFAIGQTQQTTEDIKLCKNLKLKSIRTSTTAYDLSASTPEGEIISEDTSTSLCLFDTMGRLYREYAGLGINYLRNLYYDSIGRLDHETWFWSKLQSYPKHIKPTADSDYTDTYKKITYHYNPNGRLDSSTIERGNKTIYQYNDSGYLISKVEIRPSGFVESFQIIKYGYGIHWGKLVYMVSNFYKKTIMYEYEYYNRKLVKRKIVYDDGKSSITYYDEKDQETLEELFDNNKLVGKAVYKYNQYGVEKIAIYRLPFYNKWDVPRTEKLRISEVKISKYETY